MSVFRTGLARKVYFLFDGVVTVFARIPIWVLFSIPRSWRPRSSWGIVRSVLVQIIRHFVATGDRLGPSGIPEEPNHRVISGKGGVWIDAAPPSLITGNLVSWAKTARVQPIPIPGYWIKSPSSYGTKVLLSFHGGGYTGGSAHSSHIMQNVVNQEKGLLKHCASRISRVLCVEYRLSSTSPAVVENPFPAALLDGLAAYHHLVNVEGVDPTDIILEGDSAGGNLALALTRYLVEEKVLPTPSAVLLFSPWCDIGTSHDVHRHSTAKLQADYDPEPFRIDWSKRAYLGPLGEKGANGNAYISPGSLHMAGISFKGFPRTFISAGGAENLLPQIRLLKDRMSRDMGEERHDGVTYHEGKDMPHDYVVFPFLEPERSDVLRRVRDWLD